MQTLELFHEIADEASAAARRRVVELGLVERIVFRNVADEKNLAQLRSHSGRSERPALWDGEKLHVGAPAVIAVLEQLA